MTPAITAAAVDLNRLVPSGHITRLYGRLCSIKLGWAGRWRGILDTSIGEVEFTANRDTFSLDIEPGSWVSVRLMHRHIKGPPWVLSAHPAEAGGLTAWLPDAECHRDVHLRRLRRLLGRLEPALQALFIAALPSASSQHRFFRRMAALDHHLYPGGLFDQSVEAAERAFGAWHPSERERGIATVAALLFDIGKLADPKLGPDFVRTGPALAPHPLTRIRASRACDAVEHIDPSLADIVRRLLSPYQEPDGTERLRHRVHQAVADSWITPEADLRLPGARR
jgi:hypothetical protein